MVGLERAIMRVATCGCSDNLTLIVVQICWGLQVSNYDFPPLRRRRFNIRVGLHGLFWNPRRSTCLMFDCLPRKRCYACWCCKELLVLGFFPCWRLVHTPHFGHLLILFLFFRITWLDWHTLCVDLLGYVYVLVFFNNQVGSMLSLLCV